MNRRAGAAVLPPEGEPTRRKAPPLPAKRGGWGREARRFWAELWQSPLASRFLRVDVHGLAILADLFDRYVKTSDETLLPELRLYGERFGLSPIARRRLEWEIRDPVSPEETEPRSDGAPRKRGRPDPRNVLRGAF
jgi:hypothetical protein